jgi:hypothetical protein
LAAIGAQNASNVAMQSNINNANAGIAGINAQSQNQLAGGALSGIGSGLMMPSSGGAAAASSMADGGMIGEMGGAYDGGGMALPPLGSTQTNSSGPQSFAAKFAQGYKNATAPAAGTPPAAQQAGTNFGTALGSGIKSLFSSNQTNPAGTPQTGMGGSQASDYTSLPDQAVGGSSASDYTDLADAAAPANMTGMGAAMAPQGMAPMAPAEANGGPMQEAMQLAPLLAMAAAGGGQAPMKPMPPGKPKDMKSGGHVPGKPKVGGAKNTLKNDTVPAVLSPGEVVIPRSVMMGGNPSGDAAKFIQAIMAKKGGLPSQGGARK